MNYLHTIALLALVALAPCCERHQSPAKAQRSTLPAQAESQFKLAYTPGGANTERKMMRTCLSTRLYDSNHYRLEYPSDRLEYCIAQIKNYRNLTR